MARLTWRGWAGFAAFGSAVVSACLGDWAWAAVTGVAALLPLAWWVRSEMATTRRWMAKVEPALAEMVAVAARCEALSADARRRAARMAQPL